jgi:membrane fusion protein, multidrug efflux system
MTSVKNLLHGLLLIGAAGGLYGYFSQPGTAQVLTPTEAASPAIPVEAATARAATVTEAIQAIGSLRPNEGVVIRPELDGRIARIQFAEGKPVSKGQTLISLDDAIYQAELARAKASLDLSQNNYERAQDLFGRSAGSATARDQALARQRVDQAELVLAQTRLDKMTIKAPFDGIVSLRQISVGDYVQPGQALVTLVNIDPIKVDFRVPELSLPKVRTGQKIEVSLDAYPGRTFTGTVYAISPQIDVNGRSLLLRARIPNAQGQLKPGQFARVKLIASVRRNAVLVPEEALVPLGAQHIIYRIIGGKAVQTKVRIGIRQNGQVEITRGARPGDEIVTAGQLKIHGGSAVVPIHGAKR